MIFTKLTRTREQLVQMYINSLKEKQLPWRRGWNKGININGITKNEYRGVNQLLLSLVAANENYDDPRWYTYIQIKKEGYKLINAKGKGIPVEFWSVYDLKNKRKIAFNDYVRIIEKNFDEKKNFKVFCRNTSVYNAKHIEGLPELQNNNNNMKNIVIPKFINNMIKNLGVKYSEYGNKAFYKPSTDEIVLPPKSKFIDKYSYFATQLHELCHSTGYKNRLNRNILNNNKKDYAREELIAEISSSFLMQKLKVDATAEHYDNHKTYIQSWIQILEDKPTELFKAINESNKVCEYLEKNSKNKNIEKER